MRRSTNNVKIKMQSKISRLRSDPKTWVVHGYLSRLCILDQGSILPRQPRDHTNSRDDHRYPTEIPKPMNHLRLTVEFDLWVRFWNWWLTFLYLFTIFTNEVSVLYFTKNFESIKVPSTIFSMKTQNESCWAWIRLLIKINPF